MGNLIHFTKVIELINKEFGEIDGPQKVFLLRSAASYYENLTQSEALTHIMRKSFDLLN